MLDYSQMTRGDFISSLHALILDNPAATTDDLENVVVIAVLDRDTQRLVSIAGAPLFSVHEVLAASVAGEIIRGNFSVVLTVIADEDHQTAGEHLAHLITESLREHEIPILSRSHTAAIVAGEQWRDLDTGETGTLTDPASTPVALARLIDGRGPIPDRDALDRMFAPIDAADVAAVEGDYRADRAGFTRATLATLREVVALYSEAVTDDDRTHATGRTEPELAARIGAMIEESGSARDALLGIALIDIPAAVAIYAHIANQLVGITRAHMLGAVAILFFADGHGYHAHEAIHQAIYATLDEDTTPPVTVRALIAAHRVDVEIETARSFLARGPLGAKAYGIDVPDYNPYTNE
ncbi:DUF4192 family protein [Nocardia carnea]|uniref:DUF4192 family protein n=1 Tax=Nocardia carnea TaxID=37328 RepID=UPI0002E812C0|nr:DUF4192 family protein [Nocardia carnea]